MSHTLESSIALSSSVPTSIEAAEQLLNDLRAAAAEKKREDDAERESIARAMLDDMGYDSGAIDRMMKASAMPTTPVVPMRETRNGMVPVATRKDGTVNLTLTGEALTAYHLANGKRTFAEIAELMGVTVRTGVPYTGQYVKSWLTSGAIGKKGYKIHIAPDGKVTAFPPGGSIGSDGLAYTADGKLVHSTVE